MAVDIMTSAVGSYRPGFDVPFVRKGGASEGTGAVGSWPEHLCRLRCVTVRTILTAQALSQLQSSVIAGRAGRRSAWFLRTRRHRIDVSGGILRQFADVQHVGERALGSLVFLPDPEKPADEQNLQVDRAVSYLSKRDRKDGRDEEEERDEARELRHDEPQWSLMSARRGDIRTERGQTTRGLRFVQS
jgi:hypothetical protein